jgi:hypothetical protein
MIQTIIFTLPALSHTPGWIRVRNIFKILGCHGRDDASQKSIGKAKLTSAKGHTSERLGSKYIGQEVLWGFISKQCCPSPSLDWAGFGLLVYAVG